MTTYGCLGRVLLTADKYGGYTAIGYEDWQPNVPLAHFLPAALLPTIFAVGSIPPHEADRAWPDVNEPLGGGGEWDGDTLMKYATVHAVKGYSFRRPGSKKLEYVRLRGDLYATPLDGNRLLDRDFLTNMKSLDAVTKAELKLMDKSCWLDGNFLLPATNDMFPLKIDLSWIVAPVLSLAPALSMDGKWAVGVNNYFNLPCCVVTTKGKLQACPPMSATHVDRFPKVKPIDPFQVELSPFPITWWKAMVAHVGQPVRRCDHDSALLDVLLPTASVELLVGSTMLPVRSARSLKAPDFLMLYGTGKRPRTDRSIPVGAMRYNLDTGVLRIKFGVSIVKGTTVKGVAPVAYLEEEPPEGKYWVFSALRMDYGVGAQYVGSRGNRRATVYILTLRLPHSGPGHMCSLMCSPVFALCSCVLCSLCVHSGPGHMCTLVERARRGARPLWRLGGRRQGPWCRWKIPFYWRICAFECSSARFQLRICLF